MKRLLILGVGAQGSTVAKRMNEEPNLSEIICADFDEKAVNEMEHTLEKACFPRRYGILTSGPII